MDDLAQNIQTHTTALLENMLELKRRADTVATREKRLEQDQAQLIEDQKLLAADRLQLKQQSQEQTAEGQRVAGLLGNLSTREQVLERKTSQLDEDRRNLLVDQAKLTELKEAAATRDKAADVREEALSKRETEVKRGEILLAKQRLLDEERRELLDAREHQLDDRAARIESALGK